MDLRELIYLKASSGSGAPLVEATATGNPAVFTTNVRKPINELSVPIKCYQTGSGDPSPSNVRPIIGFAGFNISHFKKNDIVFSATESTASGLSWIVSNSGSVTYEGTPTAYSGVNVGIYNVKGGETINGYLVGDIDNVKFDDAWIYDESWNHIATASSGWTGKRTPQNQGTIDLSEYPNAAYVSISLSRDLDDVSMSGICFPVVGEGLSMPNSYDIAFSGHGTVYGGTLNVTTGILTLTHAYKKFVGASDEEWFGNSQHPGCFVTAWPEVKNKHVTMSNMSPENNNSGDFPSYGVVNNQNSSYNIRTHLIDWAMPVNEFKPWLAEHPLELVCPLVTPVEIQITATSITTLSGTNIITTNTMDSNTVKYLKKGE